MKKSTRISSNHCRSIFFVFSVALFCQIAFCGTLGGGTGTAGDPYLIYTADHIQEIAVNVLAHRIILDQQAAFSGLNTEDIVAEILKTLPVPT